MKHYLRFLMAIIMIANWGGVIKAQSPVTYWKLITSENELIDGEEYLISTTEGYILAGTKSTSNCKSYSGKISDNIIASEIANSDTDNDRPNSITLKKNNNNWYLFNIVKNQYINGGSKTAKNKNNNHLKFADSPETGTGTAKANGVWSISISETGIATIQNQNKYTIYYNPNTQKGVDDPVYASYSSKLNTYKTIGLYRKVSLKTAASTFATYAADYAVDYSAAGLEAYAIALNETEGTVAYNAINGTTPAGTAVLVKGDASKTYSLAPSTDKEATVETALQISDGTVVTEGKLYYGFATINGVSGFKLVNDGITIPAKKGYLKLSSANNAKTFYAFDGDATGIEETFTNDDAEKAFAPMYNISGQRVGEDYKGIVIVNGKKYMK